MPRPNINDIKALIDHPPYRKINERITEKMMAEGKDPNRIEERREYYDIILAEMRIEEPDNPTLGF